MSRSPDSSRAAGWQLRDRTLQFEALPAIMGIVNVTPDSFSDGGRFLATQAAAQQALRLEREGAAILDIGGESTRPYADPVDVDEELRRVLPVLEQLHGARAAVSVDTSKAEVAEAALQRGAVIVNDISGLQGDTDMLDVVLRFEAAVCVMHMQGTPQTMQDDPHYDNVVEEVLKYLRQRRDALIEAGIAPQRICLDPGIGFGKTHAHNLQLMANCWRFHELGCPLLVGHSRKGFLAHLINDKQADRTAATVGAALGLARQGVQVIRVHDVQPLRHALLAMEASGGFDSP